MARKSTGPLRRGWTTGACATAATRAAYTALVTGQFPDPVDIVLPGGGHAAFALATEERSPDFARASVMKDAGDDPDVTHGALVVATVRRGSAGSGITFRAGPGVGTVTKAGLPLTVGEPAINPVPRQMMRETVLDAARLHSGPIDIVIEISVPGGEKLAERTWNPRLGIVGGISILGTTGIVRAMSTAAWRASVLQALDVAAANSVRHIVLSTGGRSERFAQALYPDLPEMAFVEMGIFTGAALQRAAERGVPRVSLCAMIGKLSKTAAGKMQTHVAGNQVDCAFLARVARDLGAPGALVEAVATANTARYVQELIEAAGFTRFYPRLCDLAAEHCAAAAGGKVAIAVVLFDFEGRVLGRAEC